MKNYIKRSLVCLVLVLCGVALLFAETTAFAWLSTFVQLGHFSVGTTDTNAPAFELWTCQKETVNKEEVYKWYATYEDGATVEEEKHLPVIDSDSSTTTFTPVSMASLYFGNIDNLAEEQDNLPVYMKYTVTLLPHSTNTVTLTEELPDGDYLFLYKLTPGSDDDEGTLLADTTANENMVTLLNNRTEYPFLHLHTYWTEDANEDYSFEDGATALPDGFADKFSASDTKPEMSRTFDNDTDSPKDVYIYVRYSVSADTLKKALLTKLKENMPAYLIFNVKLTLEVQTAKDTASE